MINRIKIAKSVVGREAQLYEFPMSHRWIPEPLYNRLIEHLTQRTFYGQVATLSAQGHPRVRTVHCRFAEAARTIGFATNQKSPKWEELTAHPHLAGCFYDLGTHLQWRWEGAVKLVASGDETLLEAFWKKIRPSIKDTYWQEFAGDKKYDREKRCPDFGVVLCEPTRWELLDMNDSDYLKTTRDEYIYDGGKWSHRRLHSVTSRSKR